MVNPATLSCPQTEYFFNIILSIILIIIRACWYNPFTEWYGFSSHLHKCQMGGLSG